MTERDYLVCAIIGLVLGYFFFGIIFAWRVFQYISKKPEFMLPLRGPVDFVIWVFLFLQLVFLWPMFFYRAFKKRR